jgi:hypothetical protein
MHVYTVVTIDQKELLLYVLRELTVGDMNRNCIKIMKPV